MYSIKSPVVIFIYNRPEITLQLFNLICRVRPPKIYLISDGPKFADEIDFSKVIQCREIFNETNWIVEIKKNFSPVNLGCKIRIKSGIDWVFASENCAIILEDDCIPDESFFMFADEMLSKYESDLRIGAICAANFLTTRDIPVASYFATSHTQIWGWATWRNRWKLYDSKMSNWPSEKKEFASDSYFNGIVQKFAWNKSFDSAFANKVDTWDINWQYTLWRHNLYSILPNINLVNNLGFNLDGTHTKNTVNPLPEIGLGGISFPLKYPERLGTEPGIEAKLFRKSMPPKDYFYLIFRAIFDKFKILLLGG